ncbi:hypothetical protein Droror1_Dr00022289 [Drosera rotundifolia]
MFPCNECPKVIIQVRRSWDAYIRPGGSRIPGHWVQSPPPADEIWASYLVPPIPRARLNFSPLGACALAGTGLPIDRFMTSDALGFTAPLRNRYWDIVWTGQGVTREKGELDRRSCTDFQVIVENEEQVEVSFTRRWNIGTRCFAVNYSFFM